LLYFNIYRFNFAIRSTVFLSDLKWQILAEAGPGEQEGKKPKTKKKKRRGASWRARDSL